MAGLSKTAANKRVRELEKLLSEESRAMHDALQYAIEDMMLDAGEHKISGEEYVGSMRFLKRAYKHFKDLTSDLPERSSLSYWGHGIYSPYDNLQSRTAYRERLEKI